jgi:hypothetical protein
MLGTRLFNGTWTPPSNPTLLFWHPINQSNITFATPAITNSTRFRVSSIATHPAATLGGTLDGTSYVDWAAGPGGYGRLAFASSTAKLTSSLAASSFKFLHDLTVDVTIAFTHYTYNSAPNGGVFLNTKATAGTGNGVGFTCGVNSSGAVYVSIGTGSAAKTITSSNSLLVKNSENDIIVQFSQSQNAIKLWVNGSLVASGNFTSFTPSSSNPGATLQVGDAQASITGMLSPPAIWGNYFTASQLAIARNWLARYMARYASPTDWDANEPHGAVGVYSFNAGGIVVHRGATATAVGSPTVGTLAWANNKYGATLNGSTQYYTMHGNEAGASGNDLPFGFLTICRTDNTASNKIIGEYDHSSTAGRAINVLSSSELMTTTVIADDAGSATTGSTGSALSVTAGCTVWSSSFGTTCQGQASVSSTGNFQPTSVDAALNVNTKAFNQTCMGAGKPAGVLTSPFSGDIVFQAQWAGNSPNFAQYLMVVGMSSTWFTSN